MKFRSHQVKGKGRGRLLGFPTINLDIPENFQLLEGVYTVRVFINSSSFIGALHYGPIPTFNESGKTLEVFLIDIKPEDLPSGEIPDLEIEIVKYLRPVLNFQNQEDLIQQIAKDVEETKKILNS